MCHTCLYLESEEVKNISFTFVRGTEYSISSFSDSGTSYDPRLEDVDIQFHASLCVYKCLCWDWQRTLFMYKPKTIIYYENKKLFFIGFVYLVECTHQGR